MPWYDDPQACTHTARYRSTYAAWKEGRAAAVRGWAVHGMTRAPRRVAVGKTIRNAVLTGGISLLAGKPAHKSGILTVIYARASR